eukprot:m.224302 g.224302  ORF g.224302 m.224302 type:complete len:300 (-) comp25876_c0_seq1:160-1059(-)
MAQSHRASPGPEPSFRDRDRDGGGGSGSGGGGGGNSQPPPPSGYRTASASALRQGRQEADDYPGRRGSGGGPGFRDFAQGRGGEGRGGEGHGGGGGGPAAYDAEYDNGWRDGNSPHQYGNAPHRRVSGQPAPHSSHSSPLAVSTDQLPPPPPPSSGQQQFQPPQYRRTSRQWDDRPVDRPSPDIQHATLAGRAPPVPGSALRSTSGHSPLTFGGHDRSPVLQHRQPESFSEGREQRQPPATAAVPPPQPPQDVLTPTGKARIDAERQQIAVEVATFRRIMALAKVEMYDHRIQMLRPGV